MEKQNFIDYVRIHCKSGKGGAGASHFRREKFVAKGGPDGGDGGRGGHIILRGNNQLWTLLHLKYRKHVIAGDGERGGTAQCTGKGGEDVILEVPIGTIARNGDTMEQEAEITQHGQTIVWVEGGKGGWGNARFKTATNQAPSHAQPGLPGNEAWKILELKLLADVGLVGFPNAGKSTLISALSNARPEIAAYPFTTLVPNLGLVRYRGDQSFVMADIPGIIEGAHEGKGLGLRFLRHIERNAVLLFMVPVTAEDPWGNYKILLDELQQYNPELIGKPRILALSQCDITGEEQTEEIASGLRKKLKKSGVPLVCISAVSGLGLDALKDLIWQQLNTTDEKQA